MTVPSHEPPPPSRPSATGNASAKAAVALVGAGPGDPRLITVRGVECLAAADVVLYDYLANPRLLEYCRPDATLVCLGKHGRDRIFTQDEINARMTAEALAGNYVVRLKGGDPAVFARCGEEITALEAAGLKYEVVPGITTALAAGSHAGIALTDRRHASAVALVTGHEKGEQAESKLDYAALAKFPGTLVFYMGVTSAPHWTAELIAAGMSPTMPVAVVRRCSWPDQETHVTTLGELTELMKSLKLRPPVLTIVGPTVAERSLETWFTERPLFGRRVVLTRPKHQCDDARRLLVDLGAEVLLQPAIEIGEPGDWGPLDAALERIGEFDWVVFSSVNGVQSFFARLRRHGRDARALGRARLAAIGPGTAEALEEEKLRADLVPENFRAEALAEAVIRAAAPKSRVLLVRASRGREVLAEMLTAAGHAVTQAEAYSSTDVAMADPEIAAMLATGRIDWLTVTSSAIAKSLVNLFGDDLRKTRLASISPITSETLRWLGHEPAVEAEEYTLPGIVQAIVNAEQQR
jgi:uroporphyrinogen III methyltransferase/synthase